MTLLLTLLALAAGLHPCVGNEKHAAAFAALSTDFLDIQNEILDKHNDLRKQVEPSASNMLKMKWNGTAANNAKRWANQCIYNHSVKSQRTIENGIVCGENLFYSSFPKSWSDAIQQWFNERIHFTYMKGPKTEKAVIGHYTQLVWYKSYLVACAVSMCQQKELQYFYVCHYCPGGNIEGINYYTPYKEGEQCGDCPGNCDDGLCTNPCLDEDIYANCVNLKKKHSCNHPTVKAGCQGSCQCTSEIQ
ncbi:cysteine-rich secretory protein 3-like [Elgaria multicarinata webbii]|uniref:cysteine-rich secretory protein 3-like n=1 Tax=Elgaria multicarinata webbii TaxID=159646 RepID=UPI002FCD22FE